MFIAQLFKKNVTDHGTDISARVVFISRDESKVKNYIKQKYNITENDFDHFEKSEKDGLNEKIYLKKDNNNETTMISISNIEIDEL